MEEKVFLCAKAVGIKHASECCPNVDANSKAKRVLRRTRATTSVAGKPLMLRNTNVEPLRTQQQLLQRSSRRVFGWQRDSSSLSSLEDEVNTTGGNIDEQESLVSKICPHISCHRDHTTSLLGGSATSLSDRKYSSQRPIAVRRRDALDRNFAAMSTTVAASDSDSGVPSCSSGGGGGGSCGRRFRCSCAKDDMLSFVDYTTGQPIFKYTDEAYAGTALFSSPSYMMSGGPEEKLVVPRASFATPTCTENKVELINNAYQQIEFYPVPKSSAAPLAFSSFPTTALLSAPLQLVYQQQQHQQQQQQQQLQQQQAAAAAMCNNSWTMAPATVPSTNFYLDLTGCDVSISVEYPRLCGLPRTPSPPNGILYNSSSSSATLKQQHQLDKQRFHSSSTAALTAASRFCYYDMSNLLCYSSMPGMVGPEIFVSVPRPLCLPRCRDQLNNWKTCMIPAWDIESFVATQPQAREWRYLQEPNTSTSAIPFTFMCYNVLCDKYATKQMYPYCPSWALNWDYRRRNIIEEIKLYQGDIVCLQEVETEQFHTFFQPEMAKENYMGIFSPKSRAQTMSDLDKKHVDGCAIFWKKDRFKLVVEDVIEFSKMAIERYNSDCRDSLEMINRVMTRDNIALVAIFETRDDAGRAHQLVVSTAHIHWDPEFCDVKLIQSIMLVSSLWHRIEEHQARTPGLKDQPVTAMPLIICGDFNSLPESGVVEYLLNGQISKDHCDFKNLGYEHVLDKLSPQNLLGAEQLGHEFQLNRAYENGLGMKHTNYTYDFKGTIDYIFYTKKHFKCIGCLDAIPETWFEEEKVLGCPHPHVFSDHFSLLVELELKIDQGENSCCPSATT